MNCLCCRNPTGYFAKRTCCANSINTNTNEINGIVLVYRPGGIRKNNIFPSWTELYAQLQTMDGTKVIQIDDSIISPVVIPSGTWNLQMATFYVSLCSIHDPSGTGITSVPIVISDGTILQNVCGFDGPLDLQNYNMSSVPITITAPQVVIYLRNGAQFSNFSTLPMVNSPNNFAEVILQFGSKIIAGTSPSLQSNPGQTFIIAADSFSLIEDNIMTGGDFGIVRLAPGVITSVPPVQPAATSVVVQSFYTSPDTYFKIGAPTVTDDDSKGFKVSDIWNDTVGVQLYMAFNVSTGSAVWTAL